MIKGKCQQCAQEFPIADEDLEFYRVVSPLVGSTRLEVPPPTLCPLCRLQRRAAFRNQMYVFIRPSETGERMFSMYDPEAPCRVYPNEVWWSDQWDPLEYGRDYDFSRPFFEQFNELQRQVPRAAKATKEMQNSDYCVNCGFCKDCYMLFNSNYCEECMYCEKNTESVKCIDCTRAHRCQYCYDCIECYNCYQVQSSQYCEGCNESYFLRNCRSCTHCFGCSNLVHKQYCVFNEQKTKEEYEAFIASIDLSSFSQRRAIAEKVEQLWLSSPQPHMVAHMTEEVSGNFIAESRAVHDSYFINECENVKFGLNLIKGCKNCYDYTVFGINAELIYECAVVGLSCHSLLFCYECWDGDSNLLYCTSCQTSAHLFGCVGLQKRSYCILNKQYSKSEYEELVPRIVAHMQSTGEWGQFFPMQLAPYAYNKSYASRYFPLTREQIERAGLRWYEPADQNSQNAVSSNDLPDSSMDLEGSIVVRDETSAKVFKITAEELELYKEFKIPLPRVPYDTRMEARARRLGGVTLYNRQCSSSGKSIRTTYSGDSPWIVWDRDAFVQSL